jgi:hypothetical protein
MPNKKTNKSSNGSKPKQSNGKPKPGGRRNRQPSQRSSTALTLNRTQANVCEPTAFFNVTGASTPGGIRVRGRELIGSLALVAASTGGYVRLSLPGAASLALHPSLFPRLTAYCALYEEYKFHSGSAMFRSNRATTVNGVIGMALDYDSFDDSTLVTSMTQIVRNISSVMANVYSDCGFRIDGKLSRGARFLTNTAAAVGVQDTLNNQGRFVIGAEGYTGAVNEAIGYLMIDYDVEFFTPQ